jgi:hypothetical protein
MSARIFIIVKGGVVDSVYSEQENVETKVIDLDEASFETLAERDKRLKAEALTAIIKRNNYQVY